MSLLHHPHKRETHLQFCPQKLHLQESESQQEYFSSDDHGIHLLFQPEHWLMYDRSC